MKKDSVEIIKKNILSNKTLFEKQIKKLKMLSSLSEQVSYAYKLINHVLHSSTTYYSSQDIENVFLALSEEHTLNNLSNNFIDNSILHVMTRSYDTGGHTRVVERWIEHSSSRQRHSLLYTSFEPHKNTSTLFSIVRSRNGEVYKLSNKLNDVEKGLMLRKIASNYQIIILHIHPHDVIPLIAFGNSEFNRPIIFFNHADHRFWLGASISDLVVNFRTWGEDRCKARRGVFNNFLLALPQSNTRYINDSIINQVDVRDLLNLPKNMKIVTSIGHAAKYKPIIDSRNFIIIIEKLLNDFSDLIFIIIGANIDDLSNGIEISERYQNRLLALGSKTPDIMFQYLYASDLVIDSYPMSGGLALVDAVSCGKPVLSLKCATGQLDYIINSEAYCDSFDILFKKAQKILLNKKDAQTNIISVQEAINQSNSIEIWKEKTNYLTDKASHIKHQIQFFKSPNTNIIDENDMYLYSDHFRIKYKIKIKKLLEYYTVQSGILKYREILLFNVIKITIYKKILFYKDRI